jgi:hypothetical protein
MGLSNSPDIFDAKMSELTVRLALPEHNIDKLPTLSTVPKADFVTPLSH